MSRSIRCLVAALVLIGSIPLAGGGVAAASAPATPADAPAGSLDVVITAGGDANRSRVVAAVERYGTVEGTADTGHLFVFASVPPANRSDVRAIPGVSSVEVDRPVALPTPAPGSGPDTTGNDSGNLTTTGQSVPWGIDRINAPESAGNVDASGVDVAVLDTGVDTDHPDLKANLAWGVNTTGPATDYGLGAAEDAEGHGTHVAGTVAAVDNARGVVGAAPDVDLYAVKVQHGSGGRYRDLIEGIAAALEGPDGTRGTADDADVVSISLGGTDGTTALQTAVEDAADTAVVLAAAGNVGDGDASTNEVTYPAKYSSTIAVGATDRDDTSPTFSSEGDEVDVAAPGVDVASTYLDGQYVTVGGTSMSTPHVAGVAALLVAEEGERTTAQFRRAIDTYDVPPSGEDAFTGQGRIRAPETVGVTANAEPSVTIAAPADGTTVDGTVTVLIDVADPDEPDADLAVSATADGFALDTRYNASAGLYEADWNTTTATEDATVVVTATVTDSAGASNSAAVEATVDNENDPPSVALVAPEAEERLEGPTTVVVAANDPESPPGELDVTVRAVGPATVTLNASDDGDGRFAARLNASGSASALPPGEYRLEAIATDPQGASGTAAYNVTSGPGIDALEVTVPARFPYGHAVPVGIEVGVGTANATTAASIPVAVEISAPVPVGPDGSRSVTVSRELRAGTSTTLSRRLTPDRDRNATVTVTVRADAGGTAVERTRSVRLVAGDAVLPTFRGRQVADLDGDGTVDDLTGDGRVTLADAVVLDAATASGSSLNASERAALDQNRDGTLSRADARRLAERAGAGGTLPSDPDGDGVYEDVNGDGRVDVVDVAWLLERFDDPDAWVTAVQEHADVTDDGRLDLLDVAVLLEEV